MLPIPKDQTSASADTNSALDGLLGQLFEDTNGDLYRLVQSDQGSTITPSGSPLVWEIKSHSAWTVEVADSQDASPLAGVSDSGIDAIADDDYFLVKVRGEVTLQQSDGTQVTAGNLVMTDGDDNGAGNDDGTCTQTGDSTLDLGAFAIAITGGVADGATFTAQLIPSVLGA